MLSEPNWWEISTKDREIKMKTQMHCRWTVKSTFFKMDIIPGDETP